MENAAQVDFSDHEGDRPAAQNYTIRLKLAPQGSAPFGKLPCLQGVLPEPFSPVGSQFAVGGARDGVFWNTELRRKEAADKTTSFPGAVTTTPRRSNFGASKSRERATARWFRSQVPRCSRRLPGPRRGTPSPSTRPSGTAHDVGGRAGKFIVSRPSWDSTTSSPLRVSKTICGLA